MGCQSGSGPPAHDRGDVGETGPLVQEPSAYVARHAGQAQQSFHGRAQDAVLRDVGGELVVRHLHGQRRPEAAADLLGLPDPSAYDQGGLLRRPVPLQEALPLHGVGEGGQQVAVVRHLHLSVTPGAAGIEAVAEEEEEAGDGHLGRDADGDRRPATRRGDGHRPDLAARP